MGKQKKQNEFELVRIRELDAWDVAFHKMLGIPMEKVKEEDYNGNFPASLDSMEMWRLCKAKAKNGNKLKYSDAVINVMLPNKTDWKTIVRNGEIETEFPSEFDGTDVEKRYKEFKKLYDKNKEIYEQSKNSQDDGIKQNPPKSPEEEGIEQNSQKSPEEDDIKQRLRDSSKKRRDGYQSLMRKFVNTRYRQIPRSKKKSGKSGSYNADSRFRLRFILYEEGIDIDTADGIKHYVVYKRSANKAKKGSCLFILEELYKEMMDWTWFGKRFEHGKECDLTSMKAYEALSLSSIENIAVIKPENILLIDSVKSDLIAGNQKILTKTEEPDGKTGYALLDKEEYKRQKKVIPGNYNIIWDGQALVDESVFKKAGYIEHTEEDGTKHDDRHGMMLLRNRFFKACAFNTKIQEYYKEKGIETVTDMFGRKMKASSVRMIVTPDSIKYLKFANDLFGDAEGSGSPEEKAYDYWKKNISDEFGVVKVEKASHLGNGEYHEIGYQVINTLPLKKEDMEKILEKDLEYIKLLKENPSVMLHRLRNVDISVRKRFFVYTMLKYQKEFINTNYYKEFRNQEIQQYKKNLMKGRVKIKGDFYVLCSMPLEMLEYSTNGNRSKIRPRLGSGDAYIAGEKDKEPITLARFPHMSSGSICSLKNNCGSKMEEYKKWFNFRNKDGCNIVVLSPWWSNIMVKLGGADFDSDMALYIKDPTICKAAQNLMDIKALGPKNDGLPVARADEELAEGEAVRYPYTEYGMATLDHELSKTGRTIGSISNDAQLFNSYLWEEYFKGSECRDDYLKKVYDCVLTLSVLNELEIDSAKKKIPVNTEETRKIVQGETYDGEPILQHNTITKGSGKKIEIMILPYFLSLIKQKNYKEDDEKEDSRLRGDKKYWDCPMDQIPRILDDNRQYSPRESEKETIDSMLEKAIKEAEKQDGSKSKVNSRQLKSINDQIISSIKELDEIYSASDKDDDEREADRKRIQEECIDKIADMEINAATMIRLFKNTFERYSSRSTGKAGKYKKPEIANDKRIKSGYLGFLFAIGERMEEKKKTNMVIDCFKSTGYQRKELISKTEYSILSVEEQENWEVIDLWGIKYYYCKES